MIEGWAHKAGRVTAGKATGKRLRSRQRSIYCPAAGGVLIGWRAEVEGMKFSRFMVSCALHGGDEKDGIEGPRLPTLLARHLRGALTAYQAFVLP